MHFYNQSEHKFPKMRSQPFLTLWWCLFSGCGRAHISLVSCCKMVSISGKWMSTTSGNINYARWEAKNRWCCIDTHPRDVTGSMWLQMFPVKAVDISQMDIYNWSELELPMMRCSKSLTLRWRSFPASGRNMSLTQLPIKAANLSVTHHSDQDDVQLLYLHNHKSLTLRWHSFWCIVHSTLAAIDNRFHYNLTLLVIFLPDWELALRQSRAQ